MTSETWKPVVGYEGYYEVSDQGRVRSLPRMVKFGPRFRSVMPRVLKHRVIETGHCVIGLRVDRARRTLKVHRLVIEAFIGPAPEGMECCHNNGNASDNRVENLRWDTTAANRRDCVNHGTHNNAKKTHCIRGHEFTPENTYGKRHGYRQCRTCAIERSRQQGLARQRVAV